MKKKFLSVLMTAAMVTGLMTGCGSSADTASTTEPATSTTTEATTETTATQTQATDTTSSDEQITLRFSWWGGDERLAATLAVIEQFEELHPNITIEAEYGSSDGYTDKLATQLAAGTAPDIIQVDPEAFPQFVTGDADYFVDLNDYNFDFSNFEESYISQQVNGRYDGHQYGIPTGIAGPAMLVNQDLADEFGIDFTQDYTWEDLLNWGKEVHEKDSTKYLLCTNKDYLTNLIFFNYAKQLTGKSLIDADSKELTVSEEQMTEIYSYIKELYDNNVIAPASVMAAYSGDNLQSDPDWIAGNYVCTLSYISTITVMTAANESANYSVGKLPVLESATVDGYFANCPQVLGVSKASEHPEEAVMFLDYFFNNETAMETLGCTRSVPPTQKAREICQEKDILSPLMATSADYAAAYNGIPNDKYSSVQESKQILTDDIESVGYGMSTPEDAAKDTASLMSNYISTLK